MYVCNLAVLLLFAHREARRTGKGVDWRREEEALLSSSGALAWQGSKAFLLLLLLSPVLPPPSLPPEMGDLLAAARGGKGYDASWWWRRRKKSLLFPTAFLLPRAGEKKNETFFRLADLCFLFPWRALNPTSHSLLALYECCMRGGLAWDLCFHDACILSDVVELLTQWRPPWHSHERGGLSPAYLRSSRPK